MNRENEACKPGAAESRGLALALALTFVLAGVALVVLVLDERGLWWLLPPTLAADAGLVYFVWTAPRRLGYRAGRSTLRIRTFAGVREVKRGQIKAARAVDYRLAFKTVGSELPGYYVGRFKSNLGGVAAFTSARRGRGVLLELKNGERLLINPRDPKRCLEPLGIALEEATP